MLANQRLRRFRAARSGGIRWTSLSFATKDSFYSDHRSFLKIADSQIKLFVEQQLDDGHLWHEVRRFAERLGLVIAIVPPVRVMSDRR